MNKMSLTAEDLRFNPPSFSVGQLLGEMGRVYGVSGTLKPLAGERDQNHLVVASGGRKFVLKVAGPDEDASVVDYQIKTLQHLECNDPQMNIPHNIKTLSGDDYALITSPSAQSHMMRLLSFLDGVPFGDGFVPSLGTIYDAGRFQGQMCAALADFSHPSEGYFMPWDISQGLVFSPALHVSKYGDTERLVVPLVEYFKDNVFPKMDGLRKQTIHNDGHQGNMLKIAPGEDAFFGMIDFGDICYAPVVQDLSIPLTRFVTITDDPLAAGAAYVSGFASAYPLLPDELDILYDLILLRACLTVQLLDFRIRNNDANLHDLVEEYPSIVTMLENIISLDKKALTEAFHTANNERKRP